MPSVFPSGFTLDQKGSRIRHMTGVASDRESSGIARGRYLHDAVVYIDALLKEVDFEKSTELMAFLIENKAQTIIFPLLGKAYYGKINPRFRETVDQYGSNFALKFIGSTSNTLVIESTQWDDSQFWNDADDWSE